MKEYICARCGHKFESNHKTAVCENCHTAVCVVCGKEFNLQWPWTQLTCSSRCRGQYMKSSGKSKLVNEKGRQTKVQKYGTENPTHLFTKTCRYCGKQFQTTSNRQLYCGDDYAVCKVCGSKIKIIDMSQIPSTCSKKCRIELTSRTVESKYGSLCYLSSEEGRSKSEKTSLMKYGKAHYSSTEEYKERFKETSFKKYGVAHPMQQDAVKEKAISTNQTRYGSNSPMGSGDIREKARKTADSNFGGFGFASLELSNRIHHTMEQRYGQSNPMRVDKFKEKAVSTLRSKYGSDNFASSYYGLAKRILDPDKAKEFIEFRGNPSLYISSHYSDKPSVKELCKDLGVTDTPIYDILIKNNCRNLATSRSSFMEDEVCKYLTSLCPEIQIIRNCRSVISPLELDIYLPEYSIAIECNPTVTHNSSLPDPWGQEPKSYKYHQNKSVQCKQNGVFLFHIFGYEWAHRRGVIESMLRNLIGCSNTLYARNTTVCELSYQECKEFLNANHRQGNVSSSVRLGLKSDSDELVSVMTFNKVRNTIGYKENNCDWELSRFCNLIGLSVVGGASKLLSYFRKHHKGSIVSFSDVAHTKGSLYSALGFSQASSISDPGYVWVDMSDDSYLHRVNCQKKNLSKLFNEPFIDIENKSERQIMEEHGYVRVFDSGTIRWELT